MYICVCVHIYMMFSYKLLPQTCVCMYIYIRNVHTIYRIYLHVHMYSNLYHCCNRTSTKKKNHGIKMRFICARARLQLQHNFQHKQTATLTLSHTHTHTIYMHTRRPCNLEVTGGKGEKKTKNQHLRPTTCSVTHGYIHPKNNSRKQLHPSRVGASLCASFAVDTTQTFEQLKHSGRHTDNSPVRLKPADRSQSTRSVALSLQRTKGAGSKGIFVRI